MVRRFFTFAVAGLVVLCLGAVAIHTFSPGTEVAIEALVRDHGLGWDDRSCQSNPSACLSSKYEVLTGREQQITELVAVLQSEEARLSRMVEERETVRLANSAFLVQGRDLLNGAAAGAAITFAGRTYPDAETFRSQLLLLFTEQGDLEKAVTDARDLRQRISERSRELMTQHGSVRAARQLIPAKLALLRGNEVFVEFDESIATIEQALTTSGTSLSEASGVLASTQQLIASETGDVDSSSRPSKLEQDFEDFLQGRIPADTTL